MAEAKQTATRYTVQQLQPFSVEAEEEGDSMETVQAWVDLGEYEGINNRKAVEAAMEHNKLEQGDFRAIPETSAKVFKPRVRKRTEWM